jgi:uncharacterized phiE125 gp8 family phage protein
MMLKPVRTVAPASLPVTLAEAKAHLRVDDDDDDALIDALIAAATGYLDGWSGVLGRCIVSQTWRQDLPEFPACGMIRLPFPDVASVTVAYTDTTGAAQTLAAENYDLAQDERGSFLRVSDDGAWPGTKDIPDAVRVTMVAGYSTIPPSLKAAILLYIGLLYENREAVVVGMTVSELPLAFEALTAPYRRVGV